MGRRSRRSGRRPLDVAEAKRRYVEDGASIRVICAETGWAYGTVHRHLLQAGVTLRPPGGDTRRVGPSAG